MSTLPSGEEKQLLEKRYEDLEFVDEIADDLKCGRCWRLTIRHYFSQCGHIFCANCRRLLTDGPCKCPQCKTLIIHMAEQKVEFEQRINAVKVTCPNKKYGCPVTTTLLLLLEHLHLCKDTQEASLPAELTLDEVTKSMLNRFVEISKQVNHVVSKVDQLEQKVSKIDQLEQKVNEIDQLQQEVNKIDKLEQKVSKIDQLEQKINKIDQLEREVNRLDKLEQKVSKIDQLEQKVNRTDQLERKINKIDQLEREVNRLDKLEQKVNKFDELEQKVNKIDKLEQKINKINQLEQKVSQLDTVDKSLEDLNGQVQQIKTKISEQPIDKVLGQMREIREIKSEMGNLKCKMEGQAQRIGKVNQSLELRANEEQTKKQVESLKRTIEQQNEKIRKLEQEMGETKQLNSSVDKLKVEMEQNFKLIDYDDDVFYNFFYCHKYEPTVLGSVVYRWTLKGVTQLMKKKTFEYESEMFPLPCHPFTAKAKLTLKDDDILYYSMCFKNSSGHVLQPNEVIPQLICVLKDVKNKQEVKHRIRKCNFLFNSPLQYDTYYCDQALSHKSWLTDSDYNANDSVEILLLVEPPSVSFRLMSTDGSIVQRISHYQHRLQLAQERHYEYHCSPYFSTKLNGYRVGVWMWLDGYGDFQGKGLTADILFLCGEYDSQLANSFKHKTTVTLMNQTDLGSHLIQTAEEDISVNLYYNIDVATHKEIQDGGYLLNDSLIYQINIQPK